MSLNTLRRLKHGSRQTVERQTFSCAVNLIWKLTGGRVCKGPFRGLRLSNAHVFGASAAKILGTYEQELHESFERLRRTNPKAVVNIGGAEGYYAVGIAKVWGVKHLVVFETLEKGRQIISDNAMRNGVRDSIEIRAKCSEPDLFNLQKNGPADLLIMDVEGAELDLLSERVVPLLVGSFLLIESHDFVQRGCTEILAGRLSKTHEITFIESRERISEDFPLRVPMLSRLKTKLIDEQRPEKMVWLVGQPKSNRLPEI